MIGKTALVTGSGRNIGRATALEFAARGANVVVNARSNRDEAEAVAEEARELGVRAIAVVADVGNLEDLDSLAEAALAEFGRVDVLVNNAGLRRPAPITEMSVEDWREVMAVNLDGPVLSEQDADTRHDRGRRRTHHQRVRPQRIQGPRRLGARVRFQDGRARPHPRPLDGAGRRTTSW